MKMQAAQLKAKALPKIQVEVPAEVCAADLRSAATALEDLAEDTYPNTLASVDRMVLLDIAGWLRRASKTVEPRDVADWEAVQAFRIDREERASDQLVASRYGVGEATVREASFARHTERSKRRIVR